MRNRLLLVFLVSFCCFTSTNAQNDKRPLVEILSQLENEYNIVFTYSLDAVKEIQIDYPEDISNLQDALEYIESRTKLSFDQLDQTYIAIIQNSVVCATVVSGTTKEALPMSAVKLPDGRTLVTNEQGYFEVESEQPLAVEVYYLGYRSKSILINPNEDCGIVILEEKPYVLPEVVIDNYLVKGLRKTVRGSIIIDNKALELLPGLTNPDVLQTVQNLPGIQSFTEKISEINVRSGTNDQNLIVWEGIRMYQQGHFFGLISAFNPYLIQDVQLFNNGTPAFYSEGVSSTMVINTNDDHPEKVNGGAGIDMLNIDAYINLPVGKKASLRVAGRRSIADILRTPTYENYFERIFRGTDVKRNADTTNLEVNENFIFYDITSTFNYDISKRDRLEVNFLSMSNSIGYQESESIGGIEEQRTSSLDQNSLSGGITLSRLWSSKFRTSGSFYATRYQLEAVNNDIGNDQVLEQQNEVVETGLKLDGRVIVTENIDIHSGYQFLETGVKNAEQIDNPPFQRTVKEVLRVHALFGEVNYQISPEKSLLSLGLRGNYFEKFSSLKLEPRLSFTHQLGNTIKLEVLGEIKNQYTSQIVDLQNDFLGVENRRWILANEDDFPLMKSGQISAGLSYNTSNLLLTASGYLKSVEGISSASQAFQNQFQFERTTGNFSVYGTDFLVNYFERKYRAWMSYSFAHSSYDFAEYDPSEFPNNLDVRHTVSSGITYEADRYELSLGATWRTGVPFTPVSSDNPVISGRIVYQTPNSDRLPDYFRVDVSGKYRLPLGRRDNMILGVSVWNLTNNENIVNSFYVLENNEASLVNQKALQLTPNLMIRYEFN